MPLLICLRHGETDLNRQHRWQGHADEPLNATGRAQAMAAHAAVAQLELDLVVTSDLGRAIETAALALGDRVLPHRALADWREVDAGSWTGLTEAEARERFPEGWARYRTGGTGWDDGETYAALQERAGRAARDLASSVASDARVLVVCHAGTIRGLAAHALALDPDHARRALGRSDYLAASTFAIHADRIEVLRYNVPLATAVGGGPLPD